MGLPLQVRREMFTSVGDAKTFSKTNSTLAKATAPAKGSPAKNTSKLRGFTTQLRVGSKSAPRYALHVLIILAVALSVGVGRVNSQTSLTSASVQTDQTSLITTAATLSEGSQNLLAADITQKAKDLDEQAEFASSGDEFLSKRQPVMTAGSQSKEVFSYSIKDGDTLSSISQKFNITTDTIKWANNITDENAIKPGSKLTILPISGILHVVEGGDDLATLAARYSANSALIDSFNSLEGKAPAAGQKLIIPDGVKIIPTVTTAAVASSRTTTSAKPITYVPYRGGSFANTYSYGYCTWYVASRRQVPSFLGNANQWPYNAPRAGMNVGSTPVVGAAGVTRWGNHVVYIERVEGGTVYYSEMNGPAGWGRVNSGSAPASNFRYVH